MSKWIMAGLAVGLMAAVHPGAAAAQSKSKGDRTVLTLEEIQARQDITNAYEAVQRLRAQWLKTARSRGSLGGTGSTAQASGGRSTPEPPGAEGASSAAPRDPMARVGQRGKVSPVLYIDDVKQDEVEELQNIRISEVAEIRYLNGTQALGRYGDGHEAGAILLKTNRLGR